MAEGLCELFSYLWDESQAPRGERDEGERRRRMEAMEASTDPVYGAGFRDALAAYRACGSSLTALLARVRDGGGLLPRAGGPQAEFWARQPGRGWQGRSRFHPSSEDCARPDSWRRARAFDESRRTGHRPTPASRAKPAASSSSSSSSSSDVGGDGGDGQGASGSGLDLLCSPCADEDSTAVELR